ncbi:hypothetical protein [Sphingomonas sp. LR55]|uniref:hypothetical protein n=1 Tax=Sphingomonas sp. LR55 TaxID=3050231 RepID=UPI002FDF3837
MRIDRRRGRLAIVLPAIAGLGLLAGGLLLLPNAREIRHAERRAQPVPAPVPASSMPAAPVPPPVLPPLHPTIAAQIATADAAALAALTVRLIAEGQPVSTLQVTYDLVAAKRPAVALDYLAIRSDGATAATWRLRVDLLRRAGRTADAAVLVTQATQKRGPVAAEDIVAAAYAIDRPDLVIAAAANHVIPPPDATLSLDLARRADTAGRGDLIALLDKATAANWRAADPWLAIRVAARANDTAAGLRAADYLPVAQRPAARGNHDQGGRPRGSADRIAGPCCGAGRTARAGSGTLAGGGLSRRCDRRPAPGGERNATHRAGSAAPAVLDGPTAWVRGSLLAEATSAAGHRESAAWLAGTLCRAGPAGRGAGVRDAASAREPDRHAADAAVAGPRGGQ